MKFLFSLIFFTIQCNVLDSTLGKLPSKTQTELGFLSYLARIKPQISCFKMAKKIQLTYPDLTTNIHNCTYDYSTISTFCQYEKPEIEDNIQVTKKRMYYNSTQDFINQRNTIGKTTQIYEIQNEDKKTKKQFIYGNDLQLQYIKQFDGTQPFVSGYDSKGRFTNGIISGFCEIPITQSYDDTNLIFLQKINFDQTGPSNSQACIFFGGLVPNLSIQLSFDSNFSITKKIINEVNKPTNITNYNNLETEEVCTGKDGVAFNEPLMTPEITSLTPNIGFANMTQITITGKNFDPVATNNQIRFVNDLVISPSSATTTRLVFTIPSGLTQFHSAGIKVTNSNGSGYSKILIIQ